MGNHAYTLHHLRTATHEAFLEPLTGQGMMRLPRPSEDVYGLGRGLHEAGHTAIVRELEALGFEPTEAEDGDGWCIDGIARDGLEVIGLNGRDPIITDPSVEEMAAASQALAEAAGLVR